MPTRQLRITTSAQAKSTEKLSSGYKINRAADDAAGLSVSSFDSAGSAMTKIQSAIDLVSGQRSALGALQNRLEHTIANLDNVSENTQSAESRIRDTDMAEEMVNYSKNNILAQANQSTQGVLSLLQ